MTTAILLWIFFSTKHLLSFLVLTSTISAIIITIAWSIWENEIKTSSSDPEISSKFKFWFRVAIFSLFITGGLRSLYPSDSDLRYIIGGTALFNVSNTEEAQKLPENVLRAANNFLEKYQD